MTNKENLAIGARFALMVIVYAIFAAQLQSYYTVAGVSALLTSAVLTGLICVGVAITMIAGEMDLSVGSMAALSGIFSVIFFPLGLIPAIVLATLICTLLGAIQGWCIHRLNINSVVFTIGTLIGIRGLCLFISGERTALIPFDRIAETDVLVAKLWILTPLSICLIVTFIVAEWFMSRTLWGREIYAIGGARDEARAAGVSLKRPTMIAFSISAGLAGLAGALLSLRAGSASPLSYETVVLEAITACLLGGILLSGGRGRLLGVAVGLFTIRLLVSGIAALGAPFWMQNLAVGALLIIVIASEAIAKIMVRRRELMSTPDLIR